MKTHKEIAQYVLPEIKNIELTSSEFNKIMNIVEKALQIRDKEELEFLEYLSNYGNIIKNNQERDLILQKVK